MEWSALDGVPRTSDVPSRDVEVVFVKIPGNGHGFGEELPAGVVPLVKKKENVKCQRYNRRYSFSVEYFQIVPALISH